MMKRNFRKKILKNGMTILFERREIPIVSVAFAVRAGGIHESEEEKGISHFIEHLLYKGTPSRSAKKIAEEIELRGGVLNGFTSEEVVAYWCKMPSMHLKIALEVLSDMIKNPLFKEEEIEKERKVIFEEIKMYRDNPSLHCHDEIQKCLYTGTMGIGLAGTFETMGKIDRGKIIKKFKDIYVPKNLILCVVGDADFKDIVNFSEKNFGTGVGKITPKKFGLKNEIKIEKRKGLDQANLIFAYHAPLASDKSNYAARILSALMAEGMSSRLFEEIREKRNLAYAVNGNANINRNFAYNTIYVGTKNENIETVKKLILAEFKKVSENISDKEIKQTKEQLIGNHQISMEDSQNQMVNLISSEVQGKAEDFYEFEKSISKVTLKEVKEIASRALKNYSFFTLVPEE